jgi:AcrR family transcriptional regulator
MKEEIANLKKNHILDIASRHFTESGFDATQISGIAKEAGVSIGTIYGFFENKEGLFAACINKDIEQAYAELVEAIEKTADPVEKLRILAQKKFEYIDREKTHLKTLLNKNPMFLVQASLGEGCPMKKIYDMTAEILRDLAKTVPLRSDDFVQMAYNFKALSNGYIERWAAEENYEFKDKSDEVVAFFMNGIKR